MGTVTVDIVGGSISGLTTASAIKENNPSIEVTVYEKYKTIGYNHEGRRCGEAHSLGPEWMKWIPDEKSIFNRILKGEVSVGKKLYKVDQPPDTGFILNRQEFICQLARYTEQRGVHLQTNTKISSYTTLTGDYIVDASGCPSTIKRELGFTRGIKGTTFQQTLENANCFIPDTVKIFFTSKFGYFWIFPRNPEKREVNIGVGILGKMEYDLRALLEEFKADHHITGTVNYVTGGLVPLGLQRPFMYKNILFVGDAGVGAFPFTGQGIYRALISGDIAGRCIALGETKRYPHIINKEFLKWDTIGTLFLKGNTVIHKIRPEFALASFNYMTKVFGIIH